MKEWQPRQAVLFYAVYEYKLASLTRKCFLEVTRTENYHSPHKRYTGYPANHFKFLRPFSQKGASQHCKSLVPYCMIHTMNEPLIDRESFEKVQSLIHSRRHTRSRTYDFLLKGLTFCHECGHPLAVINRKTAS